MPATKTIFDEIESRLSNMTTANGYYRDIGKIGRARLEPYTGADLPAVNFWAVNLRSEQAAYGLESRELILYIEIHDITRDRPFIDIADELASDVIRAISRSTLSPRVTDPKIPIENVNVVFQGYDYEIGQGQKPFCGALLSFSIQYHANINDLENIEK